MKHLAPADRRMRSRAIDQGNQPIRRRAAEMENNHPRCSTINHNTDHDHPPRHAVFVSDRPRLRRSMSDGPDVSALSHHVLVAAVAVLEKDSAFP